MSWWRWKFETVIRWHWAGYQEGKAMTKKTKYLGQESGKSSSKWFTNSSGTGHGMHPKGYGASTGDGNTSDTSILGKIVPKFLRGR